MIEVTRSNKSDRARMVDPIRVRVNPFVQLRRDAESQRPKKCGASEKADKSTRARAAFHWQRLSVGLTKLAMFFSPSLRGLAGRLVFAPQMEGVSEDNVSHHATRVVVAEINRGIELEITRQVAGKTNRGGIFAPALPIDLDPPGFVEIVGVTEDRFVFVSGMNRAGDEFVVL